MASLDGFVKDHTVHIRIFRDHHWSVTVNLVEYSPNVVSEAPLLVLTATRNQETSRSVTRKASSWATMQLCNYAVQHGDVVRQLFERINIKGYLFDAGACTKIEVLNSGLRYSYT